MTFTIKVRGAGGPMIAEYLCPKHGRFEALVMRDASGDPPAWERCPRKVRWKGLSHGGSGPDNGFDGRCFQSGEHVISAPAIHTQFVVSATQGKNAPKPHAEVLDTRPLAEGRKKEWRQHRKKLREERRHKRVKELLR